MLIPALGAPVSEIVAGAQNKVMAQITPDNTLGSEHSRVTPQNQLVDRVDGGAIRGTNLFHSFEEFNRHVQNIIQAQKNGRKLN